MEDISGIFESVLSEHEQKQGRDPGAERMQTLRGIKNLIFVSLLVFAAYDLMFDNVVIAAMDLACAVILVFLWYLTEKGRITVRRFGTLFMMFSLIMVSYPLQSGGVAGVGFLWVYTFPILALLLKGMRGFIWIALFLAINMALLLWNYYHNQSLPYSWGVLIQALLAYLFSVLLAYTFELFRIRQHVGSQFGLERFKSLIENSADSVVIIDSLTHILYVSPAYERITGYSADEAVGSMALPLVHPDDRVRLTKLIARYLLKPDRETAKFRYRYRHKTRGWIRLESVGCFVTAEDGNRYAILNNRDVTEQEELEEQLRQSQKLTAIGTLVGGIAHNINNILGAIVSNTYLAGNAVKGNTVAAEKLARINNLSMKARDMIHQLLTFARKSSVEMRPLELRSLFHDALELARNLMPANVTLVAGIEGDALPASGDVSQLQQMVVNLLTNARDAVAECAAPEIRVELDTFTPDSAFAEQHGVLVDMPLARLSISDNGAGISERDLENIFDPFFTTKVVGKGYGLGLSMVHGAVKMHKGVITVESEPGRGTCFNIYLPVRTEAGTEHAEAPGDRIRTAGKGQLLLLADDSDDLREVYATVLEDFGYKVLQAKDGKEAEEMFRGHADAVALLITDLVMPVMGGYQAATAMREIRPDLPVLYMTGYDEAGSSLQSMSHGDKLLHKPVQMQTLSEEVAAVLARAGQNRQA